MTCTLFEENMFHLAKSTIISFIWKWLTTKNSREWLPNWLKILARWSQENIESCYKAAQTTNTKKAKNTSKSVDTGIVTFVACILCQHVSVKCHFLLCTSLQRNYIMFLHSRSLLSETGVTSILIWWMSDINNICFILRHQLLSARLEHLLLSHSVLIQ